VTSRDSFILAYLYCRSGGKLKLVYIYTLIAALAVSEQWERAHLNLAIECLRVWHNRSATGVRNSYISTVLSGMNMDIRNGSLNLNARGKTKGNF
jgi:hypothetical protein